MPALDRAQILGTRDMRIARVPVPEWAANGVNEVCVRSFSAAQRAIIIERFRTLPPGGAYPVSLLGQICVSAICDEDGALLFTPTDIESFGERDGQVVERVATAILRMNALTGDTQEALEKNSPPAQSEGSPSA